ncbi:NUDIX domain-containing protein [Alloiococcus sp. CFN-8]|uniref:NUDIX domain-containing protein n=1 Tax=Alloiococcus sp. CFN-8 TaxID=3416081 RepID=UPI003CF2CB6F
MERRIRNSAKALIIKDGKMLATKINDKGDIFYIMPGGGQESGETLEEAVIREVKEEFGYIVEPKSLEFVIEGVRGESFHRVDLVFLCEYISEIQGAEIISDCNQIGYDWLSIENLINEPLYPSRLRKQIMNLYNGEETIVYLGDESMEE